MKKLQILFFALSLLIVASGCASQIAEETMTTQTTVRATTSTTTAAATSTTLPKAAGNIALQETEETYPVNGDTYAELTADLKRASSEAATRAKKVSDEIAWTIFNIERNTSYRCESSRAVLSSEWESSCTAKAQVSAKITIVLPRAVSSLSAADEKRWVSLVEDIRRHEVGHAEIDRASVSRLRTELAEPGLLTGKASGSEPEETQQRAIDGIEARLKSKVDQVLAENEKNQEAYHDKVGRYVVIPGSK